jgi:hypothetical protein
MKVQGTIWLFETDIEQHHRLRHRMLLQDESIHNCDFQASEIKAPGSAIFPSPNLHSNSMKFQRTNWNQLAF